MELRQLRYFTYVARLRSFSRAARQLNIAQPALSRHIRNLELEFGVKLLLRNTHGVSVTEAGERLVEMSEFVVRYSNEIRDTVVNAVKEPTGQVVVGVPPSIAYLIAPPFIEQVRTEYPKVSLRLIEGLSVFLLEWLIYGRVDIAVLTGGEPVKGVHKVHVADEELVLVGQQDIIQKFGTRVPLRALANWPLLTTHGFRSVIYPVAESAGVSLKFEMELDSLPVIKEMVTRGLGVTILPYATVHRESIDGTLKVCRLDEPRIVRRLYVAVSEFRPAHLTMKVIKQVVETQLKQLPARPFS